MTFEQLQAANATINTTDIKGKAYAEVNQRIKAFRMCFPEGWIRTEMLSNDKGVCVFVAQVGDGEKLLGTGHAYEKEQSSFINKTSYIENCETSAVGRALGMAGFGIDTSVASYEEVANAINNQGKREEIAVTEVEGSPITPTDVLVIKDKIARKGLNAGAILGKYKKKALGELNFGEWNEAMSLLDKYPDKEANN